MEASKPTIESRFQELLFLNQDIQDPKLQFILLIHAANLFNDLKCTGLLEDDPEGDYIIPPNWQKDAEGIYSFRYFDPQAKDTVYFKFVTEDSLIDINAVTASKNDKIISLDYKLTDYEKFDPETINKIYKRYRNDFLPKILPHLKPTEESSKKDESRTRGIIIEDRPMFVIPRGDPRIPVDPFGDYGRSDLYPNTNPLVGGDHSGGNLLGPRNPIFGQNPHNEVNPRIRYDPTGPDDIDPTNVDPDHAFPSVPFQKKDPRNPFGGGPFGRGPFGGGGGGFGGGFGGGGFGGGGFGGGGFI